MLALILPAEMACRDDTILAEAGTVALFSIVAGVIVTASYVSGILIHRTLRVLGAGLDSCWSWQYASHQCFTSDDFGGCDLGIISNMELDL